MKVKQHQTSINIDINMLSEEQVLIREVQTEPNSPDKKCNTCLKEKPLSGFRKRTTSHGKEGVWYSAKCKDCNARTRGTKEIGKLSFAKEIYKKGFRRCGKCKDIKPLSEYYANKAQHTGINHECKECNYTKVSSL